MGAIDMQTGGVNAGLAVLAMYQLQQTLVWPQPAQPSPQRGGDGVSAIVNGSNGAKGSLLVDRGRGLVVDTLA